MATLTAAQTAVLADVRLRLDAAGLTDHQITPPTTTARWTAHDTRWGTTVYEEIPDRPGHAYCVLAGDEPVDDPQPEDAAHISDLERMGFVRAA